MVFSRQWEDIYQRGEQNSTWPWSDLVSYVMRYARPDRDPCRVLELGFGAGANIGFFVALGTHYYGTEGSATAVERARKRFAGAPHVEVACCDFTAEIPFQGAFDLVVDRSSLTHNTTDSIRTCLVRLHSLMRPGARFVGIDWFSTANGDFLAGRDAGDYYTRTAFASGQFQNVGAVHFSDEEHLMGLLTGAGFVVERLEHKCSDVVTPRGEPRMAWWNLVALKP